MSNWIELGDKLGNNFSFQISTNYNDNVKMKFIGLYFESSYNKFTILITFSIIMICMCFIIYFIPLNEGIHFAMFLSVFTWSMIIFIWLINEIIMLRKLHKNIFSDELIFLTIEKRSGTEGSEYILLHKPHNITLPSDNDEEQVNPINNILNSV